MGKYTKMIEALEEAINMDQAFICKSLMEELDAKRDDAEVKMFYRMYEDSLNQVRRDGVFLENLLEQLNSDDGWSKVLEHKDGTIVHYRMPDGSPLMTTKMQALIPCRVSELADTFIKLLSLFSETTLVPKWFPFGVMRSNETLKAPTSFTRISDIRLKFPIPINAFIGPRECVIRGKGYDISEERAVAISVSALEPGSIVQGLQIPELATGYTRFIFNGAYYLELSREGIIFKQLQLIDPNSNFVPSVVVNWIAKGELPLRQIKAIKKKLKHFRGSVWEEKIREDNYNIYKDVRARLLKVIDRDFKS